ncbi:hypothetical protein J4E86_003946 [Alternaria arbusti]|uniref:uncharacterized protein n=1 Tax=Alternaria arbusti TaxID=232088 RepID=UPI00221EF289|nr:uncharacterized protein J4E86_003946 [Alternaria arbusti]KAI4958347.1 hypothetical protein J4E86_003946 [Alternaria arbusti]
MPRTRGEASSGADAERDASQDQGTQPRDTASGAQTAESSTQSAGQKRKVTSENEASAKQRRTSERQGAATSVRAEKKGERPKEEEPEQRKPRLTTPDLEYEYDRSKLRDPRPTPGRKARPRWEDSPLTPQEIKDRINENFYIPKPTKPPARLNTALKDGMFRDECRLNPFKGFHDLYKCHDKGREGSPTYDGGGFELDWEKVDPYNKNKMVRGMEKAVERARTEEQKMFDLFFLAKWNDDEGVSSMVKDYVKDQVSKDIGVPWHQIGPEQVQQWRDRGFQPVNFYNWWEEPNEEEKKRMMNMMSGASLRKDL